MSRRWMPAIGGVVIALAALIGLGSLVTKAFGQDQERLMLMYPEVIFEPAPYWFEDAPGPRRKPAVTLELNTLPMIDAETLSNGDAKQNRSRLRVVDDFWYPPPFFTPEELEHIRRVQGGK